MLEISGLEELVSSSSSSSSSSEDISILDISSEDEEMIMMFPVLLYREPQHRVHNFVDEIVKNYSEEEFRGHFRLTRNVADRLVVMFQNSEHFHIKLGGGGRPNVTAEVQCLAFLWFAGNKESYREVANLFNISISTAYKKFSAFLKFLTDIAKLHIKFPKTSEEKIEKSREFEQLAGFPNVLGCIDGCYIYIRKPANKIRSTYVNRHGLISITLQGICDANKKFLDVFIGSPSKIHDSRIFKLSFISEKLPELCGDTYHILGDAAYPIREYLLTPYKDYGNLDARKSKYNKKHAQTRVKIENCFGLLKQRFRQLMRLDFFTVERMCYFLLGACVLHNLCIDSGDLWDEASNISPDCTQDQQMTSTEQNNTTDSSGKISTDNVLKHLGEVKRNRIASSF